MECANSRGQCTLELVVVLLTLFSVLCCLYALNDRDMEDPFKMARDRSSKRLGDLQSSQLSEAR